MHLLSSFEMQHADSHASDVYGRPTFVDRADIAAVRAYRSAVGVRTREVVRTLRPEARDEIIGESDIARAAAGIGFREYRPGQNTPDVEILGLSVSVALPSVTTECTSAKRSQSADSQGSASILDQP